MIQGLFGDLQLAEVSINELKKQEQANVEQPQKSLLKQSQIFSPNAFHIEVQRPNFESIRFNHPLLTMDLNYIHNSQFFNSNTKKFNDLMFKNNTYQNIYNVIQDDEINEENNINKSQIDKMNAYIKNNEEYMMKQNNPKVITNLQEQKQQLYPFYEPQIIDIKNLTYEYSLNEIINYFKKNNQEVDGQTVLFLIEAFKTKDPQILLDSYIQQNIK